MNVTDWGAPQIFVAIVVGLALLVNVYEIYIQKNTGANMIGFALNLGIVFALRAGGFW